MKPTKTQAQLFTVCDDTSTNSSHKASCHHHRNF